MFLAKEGEICWRWAFWLNDDDCPPCPRFLLATIGAWLCDIEADEFEDRNWFATAPPIGVNPEALELRVDRFVADMLPRVEEASPEISTFFFCLSNYINPSFLPLYPISVALPRPFGTSPIAMGEFLPTAARRFPEDWPELLAPWPICRWSMMNTFWSPTAFPPATAFNRRTTPVVTLFPVVDIRWVDWEEFMMGCCCCRILMILDVCSICCACWTRFRSSSSSFQVLFPISTRTSSFVLLVAESLDACLLLFSSGSSLELFCWSEIGYCESSTD